jgi:hypothetical protein
MAEMIKETPEMIKVRTKVMNVAIPPTQVPLSPG